MNPEFIILAAVCVFNTIIFAAVLFRVVNTFATLTAKVEDERRDQAIRDKEEREAWQRERHTLLERIQRPEFNPGLPIGPVEVTPDESIKDELHLVGQVVDITSPDGEPN